jgi:hypothetical protein
MRNLKLFAQPAALRRLDPGLSREDDRGGDLTLDALGRVDIHFVQMKALTMWSMDRKALAVCS